MNAMWRNPGLVIADRWQRGFPICERPYAEIGAAHDLSESEVVNALGQLLEKRLLSRIGAVVRPNTAGASTLAALSCPPHLIEHIARLVSAEPCVNHNYEREHAINLWFVVAAPSAAELAATLKRISGTTGCQVYDLRLERPYHIDLGFGLGSRRPKPASLNSARRPASAAERQLLAAIEDGLDLVPRPFAAAAQMIGASERDVLTAIRSMLDDGIISRFGCVVKHREVGFTANAMAVWDVPDDKVDAAGERLARGDDVTLCYRRNRMLPVWRYNLFAMIHGNREDEVRARIAELAAAHGLAGYPHEILFSRRCFTQRGARFAEPRQEAAA